MNSARGPPRMRSNRAPVSPVSHGLDQNRWAPPLGPGDDEASSMASRGSIAACVERVKRELAAAPARTPEVVVYYYVRVLLKKRWRPGVWNPPAAGRLAAPKPEIRGRPRVPCWAKNNSPFSYWYSSLPRTTDLHHPPPAPLPPPSAPPSPPGSRAGPASPRAAASAAPPPPRRAARRAAHDS